MSHYVDGDPTVKKTEQVLSLRAMEEGIRPAPREISEVGFLTSHYVDRDQPSRTDRTVEKIFLQAPLVGSVCAFVSEVVTKMQHKGMHNFQKALYVIVLYVEPFDGRS